MPATQAVRTANSRLATAVLRKNPKAEQEARADLAYAMIAQAYGKYSARLTDEHRAALVALIGGGSK